MARGWESKSVESQIEEAAANRAARTKPRIDPAETERLRTRGSLELARKRVLHELSTNTNPRREEMLRASLKYLDDKISELK